MFEHGGATAPASAVDLFAGAGGLSLGLKRAGFRVLAAIESDEIAAETYRSNHADVLLIEQDIRRVAAARMLSMLRMRPGELTLLAGCPPCQAFSSLRTLNGAREVRSADRELLDQFLRFVSVLRPRAIMLENVPGLRRDATYRRFTARLRLFGYAPRDAIMDAAAFGVPQRRLRLLLVAGRSVTLLPARPSRGRRTVRDTIGSLPSPGSVRDPLHEPGPVRTARVQELIRLIPKNGGSRSVLDERHRLACHEGFIGFKDVYGRMAWDRPAPTITGGCINPSKGRFLHPVANRTVTLREAALLQGFPMRYEFSLRRGRFAAARLIGNALPPEMARRQAAAILRQLDRHESGRGSQA